MINVLLIVKRYNGNYPLVNEMCRLDPVRFRVILCYLGGKDDGRNGADEIASRVYYLNFRSRQLRWYNVAVLRQLVRIIDQEQIQVMNCHLQRTMALGLAAARLAAKPPVVISTLHGLGSAGALGRKMLNRICYPGLYRIVGVSNAVRRDILDSNWYLSESKVVAIPNGLDLQPYLKTTDRVTQRTLTLPGIAAGCLFAAVGRLSEVKNHRTLLRSFRRVVDADPTCALVIVGQGELEQELKQLSRSLDLHRHVVFLGFRKDIPEILQSVDVFLLPSLREGMPLSLLEAMASGLPMVGSRVGGIPEIIGEQPFGTLIAPDDLEGLADAMLAMASLPREDRQRLGEAARRRALDNFSAGKMIRQYEELYEQAAFGRQSKAAAAVPAANPKG